MSTPYVFADEVPSLQTVAQNDIVMVWDTSASLMKRCTVSTVQGVVRPLAVGGASASVIGYYGETGVNQGTIAATAVTALATATISAGKSNSRWGFSSSTAAKAFVARAQQAQTDLKTLMQRINSTGLVAISGLS
jgi:hypothetical protein